MQLRGQSGIHSNIKLPSITDTEMRLCRTIFKTKLDAIPTRNALCARAIAYYTKFIERASYTELQVEVTEFIKASSSNPKKPRPKGLTYNKRNSNA